MQELNKTETKATIFGWKEWLSFLPLFITYIILGFYAIFRSNPLLAFGYLAYILAFYIVGTSWIFCTKCPHYGQRCPYIFAGLLAKRLFKQRCGKCSLIERTYPVVVLMLLFIIPMLFVLDNVFYLLALLVLIVVMFGIVKPFIVCATCQYSHCFGKALSNKLKK